MKLQLMGQMICLLLVVQSCSFDNLNFTRIIESPDKFDGKEIEISGIYYDQFENIAIYLNRNSGTGEAMWVDMLDARVDLNGKRIKLKGRFNRNDKGHLRQYLGTIKEVKVIEN
jgi:hypothetical protein